MEIIIKKNVPAIEQMNARMLKNENRKMKIVQNVLHKHIYNIYVHCAILNINI